ncbi:unnamed protein product [Sphagnum balticum]
MATEHKGKRGRKRTTQRDATRDGIHVVQRPLRRAQEKPSRNISPASPNQQLWMKWSPVLAVLIQKDLQYPSFMILPEQGS